MLFVITGISHPQMLPWREKQFSLLFELKRLLDQAMTRLVKKAYDQLMIHQFLVGLPESMSQQLQVIGDTGNSDRLPEKAKIMITAMEQERVSAITPKESGLPGKGADCRVNRASCCPYYHKKEAVPRHYFICQQVGYLQRNHIPIDIKTAGVLNIGGGVTQLVIASREIIQGCM